SWRRERQEPPRIDGVSDDQLFFLGYAQAWCTQVTDEKLRLQVATDTHSPEQQRVNVPLAHLPAFWEAYQCAPGTPMHAGTSACEVW
ncbi:M13-type metalloendopeptidase, partial [Nannocystis sp. SCPEA4]|uniref:M13-type metalloendopeptidase n=1 Tax=Nannocystis sp. SCPEA4 TaxID=2996787 RepID=UPI00227378E2